MAKKRLILSAIMLLGVLVQANTETENAFLSGIEQQMSKIKTLRADFVQLRKIRLLKNTLRFEGKFFLQAPDRIAWQVYSPVRYSCIISNNSITQWDAHSRRKTVVSATGNSALRLLFQQLHNWFAGKFSALSKDFDCSVNIEKKQLSFKPKKGLPQSRFIKKISIFLQQDLSCIKRIEFIEKNGDTQSITFYKTIINEKLPAGTWRVFSE